MKHPDFSGGWIQFVTNFMAAAKSFARLGYLLALMCALFGWTYGGAGWWFAAGFTLGVGTLALGIYAMFRWAGAREDYSR